MLEFLLGVGVGDLAAKRLVSAALISAYCCVVAAASWSGAAFLVEDAASRSSNWPYSSSSSPCVSPPWPLAVGRPGTMPLSL